MLLTLLRSDGKKHPRSSRPVCEPAFFTSTAAPELFKTIMDICGHNSHDALGHLLLQQGFCCQARSQIASNSPPTCTEAACLHPESRWSCSEAQRTAQDSGFEPPTFGPTLCVSSASAARNELPSLTFLKMTAESFRCRCCRG